MKIIAVIVSKFLKEQTAFAHCDIPCGIYDPHMAQIGAHTVLRMTQLLLAEKGDTVESQHNISRMTHVKEEHGGLVEDELGTLENDYFKPEHFEKFPELRSLIEKAINLSVKARQKIDLELCKELLETVLKISEIFYQTKNVTPIRVKSIFPTEGEIVTYK